MKIVEYMYMLITMKSKISDIEKENKYLLGKGMAHGIMLDSKTIHISSLYYTYSSPFFSN